MFTVGHLRHRVTVQTRTEASDGHDGIVETWNDVAPVRRSAAIEPLAGKNLDRAGQGDRRAMHTVTFRYWPRYLTDLDGGRARLVWHDGDLGNRTLDITEPPREVLQRRFISMTCMELL